MNITTKLDKITDNFIKDYLKSLGIKNVNQFLKPTIKNFEDPADYENIDKACELLDKSIELCKPKYIIRDSDTDGDCSATIMFQFLKYLGCNSTILYHTGKQHGLELWMMEEIKENSLIIIPDASATDNKVIEKIHDKHCVVIELDHHLTNHEDECIITVNNQRSPKIKNKSLSGAGVTDKFVRKFCEYKNIEYSNYTDLVAISLVSDVCDLSTMENRWYIYNGLKNITNPFLSYLFEKCCTRRGYTPEAIGWDIAPLSNALARSEEQESKTLFFDALIGEITSEEALKKIRRIKRLQDEEVKAVVKEIEPNLNLSSKVLIGFTSVENTNYTGLIANKFTGKYNKPTILLRDTGTGAWSGSLRSPVPLATKINESGIASAQGHEEACGILVNKKKFDEFTEWLEGLNLSKESNFEITAQINPKDITLNLCEQIEKWKQLWGHGIEAPLFYLKTKLTKDNIFIYEKATTTIKISLNGVSFIKFFATEEDVEAFKKYEKFEIELILGELSVNEYEGVKTPQCIIKEYEIKEIIKTEENWEDSF